MLELEAMVMGMTRGEIGLVLFIFGLVYAAQLVPRFGAFVAEQVHVKLRRKR